jgi:hypothetical protein
MPEIMLNLHGSKDTGADMLLRSRFICSFPPTDIIALTTFLWDQPEQDCTRCTADSRNCVWVQWFIPCGRCIMLGNRDCCYMHWEKWQEFFFRERDELVSRYPHTFLSPILQYLF